MNTVNDQHATLNKYLEVAKTLEMYLYTDKHTHTVNMSTMVELMDTMLTYNLDDFWVEIPYWITMATPSVPLLRHRHSFIFDRGRFYPMALFSPHTKQSLNYRNQDPIPCAEYLMPIRQVEDKFYLPKIIAGVFTIGIYNGDLADSDKSINWIPTDNTLVTLSECKKAPLCGINNILQLPQGQRIVDDFMLNVTMNPIPILTFTYPYLGTVNGIIVSANRNSITGSIQVEYTSTDHRLAEYDRAMYGQIILDIYSTVTGTALLASFSDNRNIVNVPILNFELTAPKVLYCNYSGQELGYIDSVHTPGHRDYPYTAVVVLKGHLTTVIEECLRDDIDIFIQLIDGKYYLMNSIIGLHLKTYLEQYNEHN